MTRSALTTDLATDVAAATRGAVSRPDDPGFVGETAAFNLLTRHRPDAVLVAADPADVAAGVRIAARHGRRVAVQATGHGAAAAGPGTLLITTRLVDDVVVDSTTRRATVGAGATWQQLLDAAAPHGLAGISGSAPDVGVVGYTLGGGLSPLARTFGLAADHVESAQLVTVDGEIVTVDADRDPALFAALRGGGGAFGPVVALTFRLVELATLYGGGAFFDLGCARTVLHAWREWTRDLPDTAGTSVARVNLPPDPALPPPLRGRPVVHVRYTHLGDPADGAALVGPLLEAAPALLTTLAEIPAAALGSVHADPVAPMPVVEAGTLLTELPTAAVEHFLDVTSPDAGLPLAVAELRLLGGALDRTPDTAGAAFHLHAIAAPPGPDAVAAARDAVAAVDDRLAPWSAGRVLMNLAGPAGPATAAALARTWGPERTAAHTALRTRVDPDGVFTPMARW